MKWWRFSCGSSSSRSLIIIRNITGESRLYLVLNVLTVWWIIQNIYNKTFTSKSLEDWAEKLVSFLSLINLCSEKSKEILFSEKSRDSLLSENSLDNLPEHRAVSWPPVFNTTTHLLSGTSRDSWPSDWLSPENRGSVESFDRLSDSDEADLM